MVPTVTAPPPPLSDAEPDPTEMLLVRPQRCLEANPGPARRAAEREQCEDALPPQRWTGGAQVSPSTHSAEGALAPRVSAVWAPLSPRPAPPVADASVSVHAAERPCVPAACLEQVAGKGGFCLEAQTHGRSARGVSAWKESVHCFPETSPSFSASSQTMNQGDF